MTKAYFFPRLMAYLIDLIIVMLIAGAISFVLPKDKKVDMLSKEIETLQTEYLQREIDEEEFLESAKFLTYETDYANSLGIIVQVIIIMLYFMVFQFYNKGQTFGKKIMGIKVINNDGGELTFTSMVYRSLVINAVFINFVNLCCLAFMKADTYYFLSAATQLVNSIVFMTVAIMVLFRKDGRGIHDIISSTKVVMVK